jgi:thiol peroxidase
MSASRLPALLPALALLALTACASVAPVIPSIPVETASVEPGTMVTRGGKVELKLLGTPLKVGDRLPSVVLIDTSLRPVDLAQREGEVLLISVVPSLDTSVCERQTHVLGEAGAGLAPGIRRITVSRDLPFAQKRFAEEAKLADILFLSDYRSADFGRATGLLVDDLYLLARAVILVDKQGKVRYLQVVPELSHLPDLAAAFARAEQLNRE